MNDQSMNSIAGKTIVVLGIALLCTLVAWIGVSIPHGVSTDSLAINAIPSAFDENPTIPSEEFRTKFNDGVVTLTSYRTAYQTLRREQQIADWSAFGLTSLITLLAGYLGIGKLPHEVTTDAGLARGVPRKTKGTATLLTVIGVMAALASTSTGVSNRLEALAEKRWKQAVDLNEHLSEIRIEWYSAKTKEDAFRILGKLDTYNISY